MAGDKPRTFITKNEMFAAEPGTIGRINFTGNRYLILGPNHAIRLLNPNHPHWEQERVKKQDLNSNLEGTFQYE